ncbi:hypothetical protein [uncultured Eudoraea sp.]|uniref:hypothetical protein n=1 Tax=uncultured Eudoraea sp. TaxID=1035614 RepID=UPI00261418FE|nr:hypothetical protein [uncultured Eudoraea sp.]
MKRSISANLLILLIFLQAISAVPAGLSLIIDPSGKGIGLPPGVLENTPFKNFLIPGLFLFVVLGLLPLITLYGLLSRKKLNWAQKINWDKKFHWSCTFSFYIGLLLILWINMQLYFGITFNNLHFSYTILGVLILILSQVPDTKRDFMQEKIDSQS